MISTAYQQGVDAWCFHIAPPAPTDTDDAPRAEQALPTIVTDADLDAFLLVHLGVVLPNVQVCQHHSTPWRAFHEAYFGRTEVSVWKASRGFGGKTFTLGLLAFVEAVTLRADVNVLGGSGVQSKRVLEHISAFWENPKAPRWCLPGSPNSQVQKLKWGNRIQALMASSKSVRGPHPQRLRIDEADETKIGLISDALGQPMSKGWVKSQVVLSSTHQYPNGPMTWVLQEAASKGWPVHEWCFHETTAPHGWLEPDEIARKRKTMTTVAWNTEVELQEPSGEGRAIVPECVKAAFVETVKLDPLPTTGFKADPDEKYGTGGDWAKKVNHTVVPTIHHSEKPARVCAIERTQRKPYPVMVKIFNDRVAFYGGTAAHDNTGLGTVVADLIEIPQGRIEHFDFAGRERNEMLSEYIADLETGLIVWPKDDNNLALAAAFKEHLYATVADVYGRRDEGHLPDTISAAALAWRACKQIIAASGVREEPADESAHLKKLASNRPGGIVGRRRHNKVTHGPRPGTKPDAPATPVTPTTKLAGGRVRIGRQPTPAPPPTEDENDGTD